jgi:cytoskeletal protein RodZ
MKKVKFAILALGLASFVACDEKTKKEETVTAPIENSPLPDPSDTVPIDTNVSPFGGGDTPPPSAMQKNATKEATEKVVEETKEVAEKAKEVAGKTKEVAEKAASNFKDAAKKTAEEAKKTFGK